MSMQKVKWTDTRPASGKATAGTHCFYCDEALGDEHKAECVCRKKVVIMRLTIEYPALEPESWDMEQVDSARNRGTWCKSNSVSELNSLYGNGGTCACRHAKLEVVDTPIAHFAEAADRLQQIEQENEALEIEDYIKRGFTPPEIRL